MSSSRKRLIPQLLSKGGILNAWGKKLAVAMQRCFYDTLPDLPAVGLEDAEIAWFLYDLEFQTGRFDLSLSQVVYTEFWPAMDTITMPRSGDVGDFIEALQRKLNKQGKNNPRR